MGTLPVDTQEHLAYWGRPEEEQEVPAHHQHAAAEPLHLPAEVQVQWPLRASTPPPEGQLAVNVGLP